MMIAIAVLTAVGAAAIASAAAFWALLAMGSLMFQDEGLGVIWFAAAGAGLIGALAFVGTLALLLM